MKAAGAFLRRWLKATAGPNRGSVSLKPQGVGRCGQEDGGVWVWRCCVRSRGLTGGDEGILLNNLI
jgi:hypothetical protein